MSSKEYFNKVSSSWNEMQGRLFSIQIREKAIAVADIREGSVAVDLGAGTGFITEELLKNKVDVIAVDQSIGMFNEMKKKFPDSHNIDYRIGESEILPIDDNSTDYVFANMYLHHVEHPLSAIQEMVRILKPGGKIIITDADQHNYEFLRTEQHDRWLGFKREDIKHWYKEAGLRNIKVASVGTDCSPKSEKSGEQTTISVFYANGEK